MIRQAAAMKVTTSPLFAVALLPTLGVTRVIGNPDANNDWSRLRNFSAVSQIPTETGIDQPG
jgi:hypothetical protein